jgi:hypothetical protein
MGHLRPRVPRHLGELVGGVLPAVPPPDTELR